MINSEMMVYVNLVLGAVIIGFFFVGRKPTSATKLNMKAKSSPEPIVLSPNQNENVYSQVQNLDAVTVSDKIHNVQNQQTESQVARELGVLFMYNGHDWEAHQVLGLPQGASMHQVTLAYQDLIKKSDPSTFDFFEAAYNALSEKHKKHRL